MRISAIALLLGSLCLAACNDDGDITFVPNILTGTFVLQTVNGAALPAVVFDSIAPPLRLDVVSGSITINSDNTFSDVTTFRQTLNGDAATRTVTCVGTYRVDGTVFRFSESVVAPDCGRTFTGSVLGNTLTASVDGVPAVYTAP